MIHRIDATVLFVRDLARCTTFYRDTLGLQVANSDPDSVAFKMENQYLLLLAIPAAAELIDSDTSELKIEGGPRALLAAGVEDVDAAYKDLKAKGVTFLRPPIDQPWRLRTLLILKATSGRSTSQLKRRQRGKRSRSMAL